ncbi:MAG: diadenylate cyclase CdaA [Akkermansia sp.]|nr:diadenylate cyclase CdaA [Akkermansia sp.]
MEFLQVCRGCFEIAVLWLVFYQLYRAFKDSRAAAILAGLVAIVCLGGIVLELTGATVLQKIAGAILGPGTLLVILFQPELRTALAKLGSHRFFGKLWQKEENQDFVARLCDSVAYLVSKRLGALIAIARSNRLSEYAKTGTKIDGICSRELLGTIFHPKTLLHDGAVIIYDERIVAAGCILPVTAKELKDRSLGLRHRAGIGVAELSDAVVIVVSEETGTVSLVVGNMMQRDVSVSVLSSRLTELIYHYASHEQDSKSDAS